MERMESDGIAKRVCVGECAGGLSVGGPQRRWIDNVKDCFIIVPTRGPYLHNISRVQKSKQRLGCKGNLFRRQSKKGNNSYC